jgi:hypothetical protein
MKKQRYNVKAGKNKAPAQAKARPDVWSSYVRSGDGLRKAGTSDDTFTAAINGLLTSNLNPGPGVRRARPPKYDCIDGDQSGSDDSSTERQLPSHGRPRGRSGTKRKRQRRNTKSARGSGIGESAAFSGGEFSSDSAGESGNSSSGEEEYIVKAILGHRDEEGERQYYVEWAGGSHTWEPDTYIADTALFQDYLSRLAECTVLRRKTAGRALVYAGSSSPSPLPVVPPQLYDVAGIKACRPGKRSCRGGTVAPAEYRVMWVGGSESWEAAGSGPGSISETGAFKAFMSKYPKPRDSHS